MISIITINYNNSEGLEATLRSVQKQTYRDFEHIIVDGNSTDGSKEIIKNNEAHLSYWVSEPDSGVYHAMNKGIGVSKGDYLQFLNSGDVFEDEAVLQDISKELNLGLDIYYGNLHFVDGTTKKLQTYPDELTFSYFMDRSLGHPATFIKRDLFKRVFRYNEELKIASDWEFFICAICKYNATYKHLSRVIAKFDIHGISSSEAYKDLILNEKRESLEKHFGFLMKELENQKQALRKLQKPPYSKLTNLLKNKVSKFLILGAIKVLSFLFPNKN